MGFEILARPNVYLLLTFTKRATPHTLATKNPEKRERGTLCVLKSNFYIVVSLVYKNTTTFSIFSFVSLFEPLLRDRRVFRLAGLAGVSFRTIY